MTRLQLPPCGSDATRAARRWLRYHSRERDPDIKRLTYTRSDGVKGSSYPMCAEHRPEQITRLERMGFTDIEAVSP